MGQSIVQQQYNEGYVFVTDTGETLPPIKSYIGLKTRLHGELTFSSSVAIQGLFEGSIRTQGLLYVLESARLTADIEANTIVVAGTIEGNITANEYLDLLPSAKLYGSIRAMKIRICDGAVVEGNCEMITLTKSGT